MGSLTWAKLGLLGLAGVGSYFVAIAAVDHVEGRNQAAVLAMLAEEDMTWVDVRPDGMRILLSGTAPDEASRFRAMTLAGRASNPDHLYDQMSVRPPEDLPLLAYKLDLMRNRDSVLMMGLVPDEPEAEERLDFAMRVRDIAPGMEVSDIVTRSMTEMPEDWPLVAEIGLQALAELENVRVQITPASVSVAGVAPADLDTAAWAERFKARAPEHIAVSVELRQPRQRLSPFTMQLVHRGDAVDVSSCAVETEADAARISAALESVGGVATDRCRTALGAPDGEWAAVAELAIRSLNELGGGAITISDETVTVLPNETISADALAAQGEAMRAALPGSYQLSLLQTKSVRLGEEAGPLLRLTRSADGLVSLRGPVPTAQDEAVLASLAAARFGAEGLTRILSVQEDLPPSWGLRALAATEAMALLRDGSVELSEDLIAITGVTERIDGADAIAAQLTATLGPDVTYTLDVAYEAPAEPAGLQGPTADLCVAEVNAILLDNKISFAPGSVDLDDAGGKTVDSIAALLKDCPDVPMEIGGHTDSQGREEMNQMLSQARAEAVLTALAERRVLTGKLSAKGYGETQPIADNSSPAGREANRRIAFRLTPPSVEDAQGSEDGSE